MGGKITIDSATLMNKGLELMEAHHLFGTPYDRIDVVVHPQSIIHALVQLCDGSTKAHMGYPDMRVAIGYALHHPDRADLPIEPLDLIKLATPRLRGAGPGRASRACAWPARPRVAGGTAPCALNAANEVAVHAFLNGRLGFTGIPKVIDGVLDRARLAPRARLRGPVRHRLRGARARRRADRERARAHMSWLLAFLGFAALVILHEAGHFFAAKAVGMRVERFALFFPPLIARRKRGETEYAIGSIPLGGYVKITGMNPAEEIPPEHAHRAYYRQPVWKRIVVIAAGPVGEHRAGVRDPRRRLHDVGTVEPPLVVGTVEKDWPAAGVLESGDVIVAVDGKRVTGDTYREQQSTRSARRSARTRAPRSRSRSAVTAASRPSPARRSTTSGDTAALPLRLRLRPGGERRAGRAGARQRPRGRARCGP